MVAMSFSETAPDHVAASPGRLCHLKKKHIDIFVINLKRSKDRKDYMEMQLEGLGFPYEFIEAVDGKVLTDDDLGRLDLGIYPPWPSFNARKLSRSEIGCTLSHLGIYQKMIDECIEWACIIEDDAVWGENLKDTLTGVIDRLEQSDVELLMLGHHGRHPFSDLHGAAYCWKGIRDPLGYQIVLPVEPPFGTHAYIIKRSAAGKLLEHAYPLRMPMDVLIGHSAVIGVKMRILSPRCIMQGRHLFASTISDQLHNPLFLHDYRRIKSLLGEKYPILRKIQKIVLSPFIMGPIILRSMGLLSSGSYADKRYFKKPTNSYPVRRSIETSD